MVGRQSRLRTARPTRQRYARERARLGEQRRGVRAMEGRGRLFKAVTRLSRAQHDFHAAFRGGRSAVPTLQAGSTDTD